MQSHDHPFLAGGGAAGAQLRAHDWAATPLGPPGDWPAALRTVVAILLASNQPMFVAWGPDRTLLYNEPYTAILGQRHPGALGRDFLAVWHDIRDDLAPLVAQAWRGEPVQADDITLWMERGGRREETHFSFFYSPVRDASGAVAGLFCACTDTTAQVLAQRRLAASEALYRGVLTHMAEAFALFDHGFRLLDVNETALRMEDGRTRAQMLGRTHWDLYPGTEDSLLGRMYLQCMADRQPRTMEHHYRWPHGGESWLEARAQPVPEGLAIFYRDITAHRRLMRDLADSAERVQLALDAGAIVGTWVWDATADLLLADARFARTFGLDEQRCATGLPLAPVLASIHPDDRGMVAQAIEAAAGAGGRYRCEYRVKSGDGWTWLEANGHVETDARGHQRFPGVLIDISARRQAQAERDAAHALLRTIVDAVPGVVYAKDRAGRMLVANRGTAELVGKPPERFLGCTDLEFLEDPVQAQAVMANDRRIMDSGVAEQVEEDVRLPDGTPARWLSTKAPLRDAAGQVIGLIGSSVDISERKRTEEALRESDRRKGEFLAVLSHELRNPLAPIRNGLHLLERAPPGTPAAQRALQIIRRQSDHLARLVDDLLDLTRISNGKIALQPRRLDLRVLVERAGADFQPMLAECGIGLLQQPGDTPVWVDADDTRISQVVGNLLHNALKFTPAGGCITVALQACGGEAVLEVRDTGAGMEPAFIPGMFEPFAQGAQTLARSKGGLGLGLPLVRGLVQLHGGRVAAHSDGLGRGAVFTIALPLAAPALPDDAAAVDGATPAHTAGRDVLIVEDNQDAATTLAQLLELEGHHTRVAGDGATALALARQRAPDLVLCDIGLPGMDGYEIGRRLRAEPQLAGTRLVALSGYAQPEDRERSRASGFDRHLAKPVDPQVVLAMLAAL